jgi:hypothetical protein
LSLTQVKSHASASAEPARDGEDQDARGRISIFIRLVGSGVTDDATVLYGYSLVRGARGVHVHGRRWVEMLVTDCTNHAVLLVPGKK